MDRTRSHRTSDGGPSMGIGHALDGLLDATVVPGFSRIGYAVRSSMFTPLDQYSLADKTIVVTGPTSGLGEATVHQLASMGADLVLVGRSADKLARVSAALQRMSACGRIETVVADMADLATVRVAAAQIAERAPTIHALVHNAGALTKNRVETAQGLESTIACHVLGPHLMTTALMPVLHSSRSRVITVSSGGMYAATLTDISRGQSPQMPASSYDGTKQYAIAKRLQVTLNEMWASREHDVTFAAMHPGWADTPGVQSSLPAFRLLTKPLLRTAAQGADTISWLAADDHVLGQSGKFWCDRAIRDIHRLPRTKKSDTDTARSALWAWCDEQIGAYLA